MTWKPGPSGRERPAIPAEQRLGQPAHRDHADDWVHLRHGRDHPHVGTLIKGALEAARERGNLLLIGETEGDPELERRLIQTMHDRRADGLILASMYTRKIDVPKAHYELGRQTIYVLFGDDDRPRASGEANVYRVPMPLRERGSIRNVS